MQFGMWTTTRQDT